MGKRKKDNTYAYYNKHTFWNDHHLVREYMNELATGDKKTDWMHYSYAAFLKKKKNLKVLSVSCGNGWQDRDFDHLVHFKKLVGYDISESLLNEARKAAKSKKYIYKAADLNRAKITERNFDVALNVAGLHHVENMDHIVKEVYNALSHDGLFLHFDYIGPKRNQYSDAHLYWMNRVQNMLPKHLVGRTPIVRPDVRVMMKEDPSEAVGSEKIIPSLGKYFDFVHVGYMNGGLMYQILYNHIQNFDLDNALHNSLLLTSLELERHMTYAGKLKPFFAFIVCKKKMKIKSFKERILDRFSRTADK